MDLFSKDMVRSMKFKVGDRVRVRRHQLNDVIGYEGTIIQVNEAKEFNKITVFFDNSHSIFHNGNLSLGYNNRCWNFSGRDLELIVNDCKLNRILYPELKPDGKGNLK